jgi:hypothetical protein
MFTTKGNGLDAANDQPAEIFTKDTLKFTFFLGTSNPRHLRVIQALMTRPRRREDIDSIAGCSNGPQLIADLRWLGLIIPCTRISFIDRDGFPCRPGIYNFTHHDRRLINHWFWKLARGAK